MGELGIGGGRIVDIIAEITVTIEEVGGMGIETVIVGTIGEEDK
jgi:hypothetical protein